MNADTKCSFCENTATHRIDGYAEDGTCGGPVFSFVCDVHLSEIEAHDFSESDYHGYAYVTDISPVNAEVIH